MKQGLLLLLKQVLKNWSDEFYLDLHGLPPTKEQSERFKEAFHNDPDAAWEKLVDEH